jgi:predicted dienelactone hydrolase
MHAEEPKSWAGWFATHLARGHSNQDRADMNAIGMTRSWSCGARALAYAGSVFWFACSSQSGAAAGAASAAGNGSAIPAAVGGMKAPVNSAGMSAPPTSSPSGAAAAGTKASAANGGRAATAGASVPAANGGSGGGGAGASAAVGGGEGQLASAAAGVTGSAGSVAGAGAGEGIGCDTTKLLAIPDDPGVAGPWPVGVKTAKMSTAAGDENVEIWYPAQLGSDAGKDKASYDLSLNVPPSDRSKIPAADNSPQPCDCYRDLPIDTSHGPYPPVVFVHGLASFRTASLTTMTRWASRGFIVLAADHLGLWLLDFTSGSCGGGGSGAVGDFDGDVDDELAALKAKSGDFAFLGDSVDMSRVGIGGHSMGAATVAGASTKPNVQVIVLLAELGGAPVSASSTLKSVLVMGGMIDTVTTWSADQSAYDGSPMPKSLAGITGGDHLDVTDICSQKNAAGETSIDVGVKNGVCALGIVNGLAHCGNMPDPLQGPAIVNYISTAVLEQTLHCVDRSAALTDAAVMAKFSALGAYMHAP